jgi:radical SAM superfamily enzyme YgiQ (UPF0313 family)
MSQVRQRSVENVMEELDEIVNKFKIYEIIFRDQSLTFEYERILRLCDGIILKGYPISWRCFSGVKTINKKLLLMMKKAGCYQINYGFESGCQEILDLSNKGTTLEESIEAARLTKDAGIEVSGSFMLGMYGDTEETIRKTVDFAIKLNCDYAEFLVATPLPSTEFYEKCSIQENISPSSIQRWNNRSYNSGILLNAKELHRQLKNAYIRFYFRPHYIYQRFRKFVSLKMLISQLKTAISLLTSI